MADTASENKPDVRSRFERIREPDVTTEAAPDLVAAVRYRRPDKEEWFRVNPDHILRTAVFTYTTELGEKRDYLVERFVAPFSPVDLRPLMIVQWVNWKTGEVSLWGISDYPDDRANDYQRSAQRAAREAQTQWVRMESDRARATYRIKAPPPKTLARFEAVSPDFKEAELSFDDMIEAAFEGRKIDDKEHPLWLELEGVEI